MLKQRIISALIGLPFLVAIFWFGTPQFYPINILFTILIATGAVWGCLEFYRMTVPGEERKFAYFGLVWTALLIFTPHIKIANFPNLLIASAVIVLLIWFLLVSPRDMAFKNWAWTIAGIFYIGWMLGYWVELQNLPDGRYWALLAMLTTFAYDTTAFFIGRTWGKHRLAPKVSPSKTWEGAIGGVFGAVAACLILKSIFPLPINYLWVIFMGFFISLFAQLGDLVESLLKRNVGVKDSGKAIPGHGGILDRIDSLIFIGAVVYYYVLWMPK